MVCNIMMERNYIVIWILIYCSRKPLLKNILGLTIFGLTDRGWNKNWRKQEERHISTQLQILKFEFKI